MMHRILSLTVLWTAVIAQSGCDSERLLAVDGSDESSTPDAGAVVDTKTAGDSGETEPEPEPVAPGSYCTAADDCGTNELCRFDDACGPSGTNGQCEKRPENCHTMYAPVCGCDGLTYGNACRAHAAGINIASEGECSGACGHAMYLPACPVGTICDFNGCGSGVGTCVGIPYEDECMPGEGPPVCGCDGNNYDSDCMRLLGGAVLDHHGTCK